MTQKLTAESFVSDGALVSTLTPAVFASPIGILCVYCGQIESHVDFIIWWLLKLDRDAGETLTSKMTSISRKKEMLLQLAELKLANSKYHPELKEALSDLDTIFYHRNCLVHGPWEVGHVTNTKAGKFTFKANRKQKRVFEEFTEERILKFAHDALIALNKISSVYQRCTGFVVVADDP